MKIFLISQTSLALLIALILSCKTMASPSCVQINDFELGAAQCDPNKPYLQRISCSCPCDQYPRFVKHSTCSRCLHFYRPKF